MAPELDAAEWKKRAEVVTSQCGGIMPHTEVFYVVSILSAARRTLDAFARYDAAIHPFHDRDDPVSAIHEALGHAAALSRFFWPGREKPLAVARAAKLRRAFQLTDDSPLRQRKLRNLLEHFDERLDEYLLRHLAGTFYPSPLIGDADQAVRHHVFRLVDPGRHIFVCLGQAYPWEPLRGAVEAIHAAATSMEVRGLLGAPDCAAGPSSSS